MDILIFFTIIFLSYTFGRVGHILFGENKGLHHWVPGLILIILGIVFREKWWGYYAIALGLGQVISDFLDMFHLKIWGTDPKGPKRFWHID